MKIDSIEIHHYRLPLDPPFRASWDPQPRASHTSTIVRVQAGDYEGVGSGDAMLGFDGHEELFIGQDPFAIERHVQLLDNLQFHYGRMWPLEVALWDLMGKMSGQPLWKLLGGRSNRGRLYAYDPPYWLPEHRDFILPAPIQLDESGWVTLSDAPGLGVEIDWSALEPLRIQTGTMESRFDDQK